MRVLVVDDSRANRNVARVLLENTGHEVFEAEGGREAIEFVENSRVDVILMDIAMPEIDGLSASRAIRAMSGPVARTPIIAWTAHDVPGMRGQTCSAGMDAYLTKPIVRATLLSTIAAFDPNRSGGQLQAARMA